MMILTTWEYVRSERNLRLSRSDWTQLPDANVDVAAWAAYRQQLRDIPQNFSNPEDVIFPDTP